MPDWKKNPYNVVSYRVFTPKEETKQSVVSSKVEEKTESIVTIPQVELKPVEVAHNAPQNEPAEQSQPQEQPKQTFWEYLIKIIFNIK